MGGGKTLGFHVTYEADGKVAPVPRYLVPMAGPTGQEVRMHLQDMPLEAGQEIKLTISAVDSAGNVGTALTKAIKVSSNPRVFKITPTALKPFPPSKQLPEVGGLRVAVVDAVDKINANTGAMVPAHPPAYKGGNHLWSSEKKLVRLFSGRNEAGCFQVNLEGATDSAEVKLAFPDAPGLEVKTYRLDVLKGGMPDVCIPLPGSFAAPFKDDPEAARAKNVSLLCEVYVPHEIQPGAKIGTLTISTGGKTLEIRVDLTVWDFTLPNKLSFIPEMNCYGTAGPGKKGMEYYRIAHEHRLCLNRLYYHWNGSVDFAPKWNEADGLGLTEWSRQFGPLFDGSAFKDLPRSSEPVDVFYLPFNEDWPLDVNKAFTRSYWADEAFTDAYKTGLRKAFAQMAQHADRKGWHDTVFEFFLNGKVYNKRGGWDRAKSLWVFDEPCNTQDFWALRWYGILYHQAVDPVRGKARMWYRADVSYGMAARNMLWGVMDVEVMGGARRGKVRVKADEQVLSGRSYFSPYGSANNPSGANAQPVIWCLNVWADGGTGVVPWQTIGGAGNLTTGSNTELFIPHRGGVFASVRVKAFRQGQQDVEYLTLLGDAYAQPHYAVSAGMRQMVDLAGEILKTSESDAGTIQFKKTDSVALWLLRTSIGEMISAKRPPYKRCVRPMPTPPSNMSRLPNLGYVAVGPKVQPARPE